MPIFEYVKVPLDVGDPYGLTTDVADEAAAIAEVGAGNYDTVYGFVLSLGRTARTAWPWWSYRCVNGSE